MKIQQNQHKFLPQDSNLNQLSFVEMREIVNIYRNSVQKVMEGNCLKGILSEGSSL